jgi:predicted DNA-binding transcriptional regulator YafY
MSKSSTHLEFLPPQALAALEQLGENLALARRRRKEPLRAWAARLGVSVRTLQRMEAGEPGVGMGVYATALWLMGRVNALPQLADPAQDQGALQLDIREAKARYQPGQPKAAKSAKSAN